MGFTNVLSAVRKQGFSCDLLIPAVVVLEGTLVFVLGLLAAYALGASPGGSNAEFDIAVLATMLGTILLIISLKTAEAYMSRCLALPPHLPLRVMGVSIVICTALGLLIGRLHGQLLGWEWGLLWGVGCALMLALSRVVIVPVLRAWMPTEGFDKIIALVGQNGEVDDDLSAFDQELSAQFDRNCISQFYPHPDDLESEEGQQWIGQLMADGVEEIIILPSLHDRRGWINQAVIALQALPIRLTLAVQKPAIDSNRPGYVFAALVDQPLTPSQQATKRIFDVLVSSMLLLFLAPLMLIVAFLIKYESPGPVLFRQQRYGFGKNIINVYKFRSMYHEMSDHLADRLTERDDPRVTRVGAFIRRFSIDELPQLLNVLQGTMSMVGPRPNPLNAKAGGELYDRVVENFYTRYRVLPGITGWAQVNGLRGNTDTKDKLVRRVEYDLFYIQHWSIWLDLKIVLLTPITSLGGENAF